LLKKKALTPLRRQSDRSSPLRLAKQPDPFNKQNQKVAAVAVAGVKNPKVDLTPEIPPSFAQFRARTRRLMAEERQAET
jgi:hypothetical protein